MYGTGFHQGSWSSVHGGSNVQQCISAGNRPNQRNGQRLHRSCVARRRNHRDSNGHEPDWRWHIRPVTTSTQSRCLYGGKTAWTKRRQVYLLVSFLSNPRQNYCRGFCSSREDSMDRLRNPRLWLAAGCLCVLVVGTVITAERSANNMTTAATAF